MVYSVWIGVDNEGLKIWVNGRRIRGKKRIKEFMRIWGLKTDAEQVVNAFEERLEELLKPGGWKEVN